MSHVLKTDRLILRHPRVEDATAVAALVGNLNVSRWLTRVPHPYTDADATNFIDQQITGRRKTFFIEMKDAVVGCIGTVSELGYWLGQPYWGQGIVTEAARAVTAHHFADGHDTLQSGHFVGNAASRNVLTKLGFVDEQIEPAKSIATGLDHDLQRMVLTRTAWESPS